MKKIKKNNLLDYKPKLNKNIVVRFKADKTAVIEVEHKGFYALAASLFFGKPKKTTIFLDEKGSFVLSLIDGSSTVYDIACTIKARYKTAAEPLYPRLIEYIRLLSSRGTIILEH